MSKLLTEADVSREYKIPRKTLQHRRYSGLPPRFTKIGGRVYYRPEDLDALIEAGMRSSTSDQGESAGAA